MLSTYQETGSVLHGIRAGWKLLFLVVLGSALFWFERLDLIVVSLACVMMLYRLARFSLATLWDQVRPALLLLVIIFLAQIFLTSPEYAVLIVARFAALILAAALVTLTTPTSEMVAAIEACLKPVRRWVPIEKVSLALSLAIRFIPVIVSITHEVREAQRVRGLDRSLFAVAMPVIIRTLKMGDQIAEALDARSFENSGDGK
ncbi:energy-coupling factor transporter transmembrane component T family protein [Sneathiella chinensis]|uniref:Cobalt ABC transporter permease n=1 Tax=Sneathiella chinensis TaxID=349750 RepID=A0ABQ5U611_9PROT|nr:energy-coupling factor transporter transmembrane protein EcfT [Sneathiella chinensis]GLQ06816.1 cobalt ABC transporter permease [Sneathiella chinensis]